jgi:hypothetical protein
LLLPNLDVTFTEQSGYNLATIRATIQLIITIKQGQIYLILAVQSEQSEIIIPTEQGATRRLPFPHNSDPPEDSPLQHFLL